MSNKEELIEMTGYVTEVLPNNMYRITVDDTTHTLIAYLGGKLKQHKIKVILGDRVRLEVSAYDLSKGRITFRL
jgi:translation initiation factor IF-1